MTEPSPTPSTFVKEALALFPSSSSPHTTLPPSTFTIAKPSSTPNPIMPDLSTSSTSNSTGSLADMDRDSAIALGAIAILIFCTFIWFTRLRILELRRHRRRLPHGDLENSHNPGVASTGRTPSYLNDFLEKRIVTGGCCSGHRRRRSTPMSETRGRRDEPARSTSLSGTTLHTRSDKEWWESVARRGSTAYIDRTMPQRAPTTQLSRPLDNIPQGHMSTPTQPQEYIRSPSPTYHRTYTPNDPRLCRSIAGSASWWARNIHRSPSRRHYHEEYIDYRAGPAGVGLEVRPEHIVGADKEQSAEVIRIPDHEDGEEGEDEVDEGGPIQGCLAARRAFLERSAEREISARLAARGIHRRDWVGEWA
ncbi:hypothetical protein P154DRAFT_530229 [Amniculicola lignicola CBS 123094]|uniref:Uncharacterized protein n=1 Tax=Amniculicola lignicola CBS 123094 TaxID=1392246 RepID=A0A6A5WW25_9PLEO|nr:hypothetical protein P154DRAFT_530229 [Amniculicola lignicola CBS 123094]